jgi:lysophospholipase L1-like esterase
MGHPSTDPLAPATLSRRRLLRAGLVTGVGTLAVATFGAEAARTFASRVPTAAGNPASSGSRSAAATGMAPTVAVLGDSITYQSEGEIRTALAATSIVSLVGRSGKTIGAVQPDADLAATHTPDIVVIDLGSNDAYNAVDPARSRLDLAHMIATFPTSHLVMVTVTTSFFTESFNSRARAINAQIRASRAVVVPWDEIVAAEAADGSPAGPLLVDGLHPEPRGRVLLADRIGQAVASLPAPG